MGLTIHYEFNFDGSKEEVEEIIRKLHSHAKTLGMKEVDDIVHLTVKDFQNPLPDDPLSWLKIQSRWFKQVDDGRWMDIDPEECVAFSTWPGEGCEEANFGLAKYPGREGWHWSSFCKTQYASNPKYGGVENFLRCHLAVVSMLDKAKELGILNHVSDEGEYYEQRDIDKLKGEIDSWNGLVAGFAGWVKDSLSSEVGEITVESPITEYPNFEHLEAKGRKDK